MDPNTGERPAVEPLYYFAVLSLMLLWLQGEKYQNPPPSPINKPLKSIWETQSLFSTRCHSFSMTYFNPSFISPSISHISKDKTIYSLQPMYTFNHYQKSSPKFQLNFSRPFNSSYILLSNEYSNFFENNFIEGQTSVAEVISIYPDENLFKIINLPGCEFSNDSSNLEICYLALIRLPLEECKKTSRFGCIQESQGEDPFVEKYKSWTCGNLESNSSTIFCIELISSASIEGIFNYANIRSTLVLDSNLQISTSGCLKEDISNSESAIISGKIISFCADPLHINIAVDANQKRIFFTQPTIPAESEKSDPKSLYLYDRSNSFIESISASFDSSISTIELTSGSPSTLLQHSLRVLQSSSYYHDVKSDLIKNDAGISNFCISSISLDSNYMDLSDCIDVPIPYITNSLPLHIVYEDKSAKLVSITFDDTNTLIITVLDASTLKLECSYRFNHFRSGWIFPFEDLIDGYIILIGDENLSKRSVHAINLSKMITQAPPLFTTAHF